MSKKRVSPEKELVCPFCGKAMKVVRKDTNLYKCSGCGFLANFER